MESSIIKLLVISTWVTSAMSANCYWLGIPWCGLFSSCGNDHYMRLGFSHGTCFLQFTRYCCPISGGDTQDVILCKDDQFRGDCITASLGPGQACTNVDKNDWASSVNTLGKCIRLYADANCNGRSKAYYPGSFGHDNLAEMNDQVSSVGRCFSHDQPNENCNRAKRQTNPPKCEFAIDVLTIGFLAWLPRRQIADPNAAMRWYQTGYGGRTESMEAIIEPRHLGTGTATDVNARNYAHNMGRSDDDAGHILAQRLGGSGTDLNNIFPQSPNINRGVWAQAEADVAAAVNQRGRIRYNVNLEYHNPTDTRPFKIVYKISDANTDEVILINDLVNP